MSYRSYTSFTCSFPADTKIANPTLYHISYPHKGDLAFIEWDDETTYAEEILYYLNQTFGKRLDEVPGLTLDLHYTTDEDEHWEFNLELEDGEWRYEESEIVFREKPVSESYVDLDAGTPLSIAKKAWDALTDVPVDDDGCFVEPFRLPYVGWVTAATPREEVWHMIEEQTGVSVAYLMGEAKNPDGTN